MSSPVFTRVVCATDFSDASLPATRIAARWSRTLQVPLVVVHSFDGAPIGPSPALPIPAWPTAAASRAIERDARHKLDALGKEGGPLAGVSHTTELVGHPSASMALCDLLEPGDLAVVGTHGRTGLARMLIGSVAEQVIRHASCPVLAVRGEPGDDFPRRLLVGTDFSQEAEPAMTIGGAIARAFGASAELMHARTESGWRHDTEWTDVDEDPNLYETIQKELRALHEAHLPAEADGKRDTAFVVSRNIPDAILEHAERRHTDLLVLATHGRTGLARLAIGSVAERVTRHATCSVLVARTAVSAPSR